MHGIVAPILRTAIDIGALRRINRHRPSPPYGFGVRGTSGKTLSGPVAFGGAKAKWLSEKSDTERLGASVAKAPLGRFESVGSDGVTVFAVRHPPDDDQMQGARTLCGMAGTSGIGKAPCSRPVPSE
jgi:hypothetical protein